MSQGEDASTGVVDEADVDTIEMELRPEDLARLTSVAGAEAVSVELATGLEPKPALTPPPAGAAAGSIEHGEPVARAEFVGAPVVPAASVAVVVAIEPVARAVSVAALVAPPPSVALAVPVEPIARPLQGAKALASPASEVAGKSRSLGVTLIVALGVVALSGGAFWFLNRDSFRAAAPVPAPISPTVAAEVVPAPVAPVPQTVPTPPADVVTFRNPFDRTEVFEFPPGTSRSDARQAVAEILIERARERQATTAN
jgi:hypothetical protein